MAGKWKVSQVSWGDFVLDGGAMFGIVPKPIWERLLPPDENNGIRLGLRSLVLACGDRVLLVDCGIWRYFSPKVAENIYKIRQGDFGEELARQTGFSLNDVTDVIATHLHFDHVGGFLIRDGDQLRPLFPRARLHVQKSQFDRALLASLIGRHDDVRAPRHVPRDKGSYIAEMVEGLVSCGALELHEGDWEPALEISVKVATGHTPGMQTVHLTDGSFKLIHPADMVPTSHHVPIPYVMAYDNEPMVTAMEKERLFSDNPEAVFFFSHDPDTPFWTIRRNEKGGWERDARALQT